LILLALLKYVFYLNRTLLSASNELDELETAAVARAVARAAWTFRVPARLAPTLVIRNKLYDPKLKMANTAAVKQSKLKGLG
jgi:hypothetical protein